MSGNVVPPISLAQAAEREIDQIERELEILRARYAWYRRMAEIVKIFFVLWISIVLLGELAIAIKLIRIDVFSGMFAVCTFIISDVLVFWWIRHSHLRWIDWASIQFRGALNYPSSFDSDATSPGRQYRSYAEFIEQRIADLEHRLSELKNNDQDIAAGVT